jgi:hypothetical protein
VTRNKTNSQWEFDCDKVAFEPAGKSFIAHWRRRRSAHDYAGLAAKVSHDTGPVLSPAARYFGSARPFNRYSPVHEVEEIGVANVSLVRTGDRAGFSGTAETSQRIVTGRPSIEHASAIVFSVVNSRIGEGHAGIEVNVNHGASAWDVFRDRGTRHDQKEIHGAMHLNVGLAFRNYQQPNEVPAVLQAARPLLSFWKVRGVCLYALVHRSPETETPESG